MFYYLLHNSSFNRKGELKDRLISTLIYGSVMYIIIHAILSFSNKKSLIAYFWFLFILDCIVFFISSDWNFYTTTMDTLNINPKLNIKKFRNKDKILEQEVSDTETDTEDIIEDYIKKNSKVKFNDKENEIRKFKKDDPSIKISGKKKLIKPTNNNKRILKDRTNIDSEKIETSEQGRRVDIEKKTKKEQKGGLILNNELPVEELNLTLENLESLELIENSKNVTGNSSSSIDEIQRDFLKKKMEDEVSDPGSDIDLEQFENSIING